MELDSADVIKMPKKCKKTPMCFVIPDLDLVVITSGDEEGLGVMEVNPPDGTVVLLEAVDEGPHAVVPELDHAAVEAGEDPWPLAVEAQALHPVALRLELRQHRRNPARIEDEIRGKKNLGLLAELVRVRVRVSDLMFEISYPK